MSLEESTTTQDSNQIRDQGAGFLHDVTRYFRDFLDTDFKRQRLPKRQISRQDRSGNLTGISLKKYPQLIQTIWDKLHKPVEIELSFKIPRGRYKATIKPHLFNLVEKYVNSIPEEVAQILIDKSKLISRTHVKSYSDDPERLTAEVLNGLESELMTSVVVPLLKHLEKYFDRNNVQGLETIFDIKNELGQRLIANEEEAIGASLNTAVVSNEFDEFDQLIKDLFNLKSLKNKIWAYFQTFSVSDFYAELYDLRATLRIHENMELYLYVGDMHFGNLSFPLFYLPLQIQLIESVFIVSIDPHLYINKKAIDYIAQEIARSENKIPQSLVPDRIIYLEPNQSFAKILQDLTDKWASELGLRPPIDFTKTHEQKARSSLATMSNQLHFAAFDKSDESLLNDYEALLTMAEVGDSLFEDFKQLVDGFLFGDPETISEDIDSGWQKAPIHDHLVYRSPIPLNEEQRKILSAVKSENSQFIVCSGPPGTGKSHTITAIAFDVILDGKNILILSDKNEALDVVENKLTNTLDNVRLGDNFQNPILRLGKSSNTYHKIISTQSIEQIKTHYRAAKANKANIQKTINAEENQLKDEIKKTVLGYQSIEIQSIYSLIKEETSINTSVEELLPLFNDNEAVKVLDDIRILIDILTQNDFALLDVLRGASGNPSLKDLASIIELQPYLSKFSAIKRRESNALKQFNRFNFNDLGQLADFIRRYDKVRYPIVGFLFTRKKARSIDSDFSQKMDTLSALDGHRRLRLLRSAYNYLSKINQVLVQNFGHGNHLCYAFQVLAHSYKFRIRDATTLLARISRTQKFIESYPNMAENIGLSADKITEWFGDSSRKQNSLLVKVLSLQEKYNKIRKQFVSIPIFDYIGQKTQLESLHTNVLANTVDERVISFHEKKRNTSQAIRDVIRKKQKFPKEQFDDLKKAFPCIIANIRDYAGYMPLSPGLFDVIIIDEASQVSIAQAFPAILRAKKMVVLGDAKQFSNVKTSNASKAINNQYLNDIKNNFIKAHQPDANLLNRIEKFNIKTSILDFADRIANYGVMLKKHFRGYKEHISYSSKYFYGGQLQAVKIRGKPIEDVVKITILKDDGKESILGNVNEPEGEFIQKEMEYLIDLHKPPTVGIITPFRDQQKYLSQEFHKHERSQEFYDKLKLKIMTFDSCQGEERQYVFYSMVATNRHDRLYGIFPKSFKDAGDPEQNLRLQRLNVGFSRVQEAMHFVLSKTIAQFSGALGEALRHYQAVIEKAKEMPTSSDVDPNSPMEAKVLDWIEQTEFYQTNANQIEIIPQFPIGEYLRQLDHTYNHPAYRVDFLLKLRIEEQIYHLIIEYDGFKEHFRHLDQIDAQNYRHYYNAEDVEREKILESYGYKILRINRFNMGIAPVITLSDRLHRLTQDIIKNNEPHELVGQLKKETEKLASGDSRFCKKCEKSKPIEEFKDPSLKTGIGHICMECKGGPRHTTPKLKREKATADPNITCPLCNSPMVLRKGNYGRFYGCSKFPSCRGTRQYLG